MKKRLFILLLAMVVLTGALAVQAMAADAAPAVSAVMEFPLGYAHSVRSVGRYVNWAGVSTASQFVDENGHFCFATDEGDHVTVFRTEYGTVIDTVTIANPYDSFGGAVCDGSGNLYLVWGKNNEGDDTSLPTIYVCKYTAEGTLVASASGNGSEGMPSYYDERFYTKKPFDAGNCDVAINGNKLVVNYAREMYSGHQANTVFVVDLSTMAVVSGIFTYNSHSFDQRVTPYGEEGFLLESQGDCYPRAFSTSVTNASQTLNEMDTFHFWVEKGTFDDYNMYQLNATRSRLGNILETSSGAALIASSVRSLSENAKSEPYDVFVQVFDPMGEGANPSTYVTSGTRSGVAGNNGDENVTDYGVAWLTNFADSGKSAGVVQAVSLNKNTIVVLYEQYLNGRYDSTWYLLLNGDGSVRQEAVNIGTVRLNIDEDPIYANGAIQWVSNSSTEPNELRLNALFPMGHSKEEEHQYWETVVPPTCTEQGYTVYACVCGHSYVGAYVDALGHNYESVTTPPTFTEQGYTTHTCCRCGDSYTDTFTNLLDDVNPGWFMYNGKWYYIDSDHTLHIGWLTNGGKWYYMDGDGVMQTGWQKIGGKWYFLNSSGAMQTDWVASGGKWYYMDGSGAMQTGWVASGGKWYYMNSSGAMQTGWVASGGKWYFMNSSGVMQTGWLKLGGKWYYMNSSGAMQTGWVANGGKWYYMNSSGVMQTGWLQLGGKWYFLNGSGVMQTGWLQLGGKWYYLNTSGVMVTGYQTINGKTYRFNSSGVWIP